MPPLPRFKLVFFVPPSALTTCKKAIFEAGAGRYPNYVECCFQSLGKGQFRPINDAKPNIGEVGKLEEVEEVRVETMCEGRDVVGKVVEALKKYRHLSLTTEHRELTEHRAHPYEEVAYEVYKMEDI